VHWIPVRTLLRQHRAPLWCGIPTLVDPWCHPKIHKRGFSSNLCGSGCSEFWIWDSLSSCTTLCHFLSLAYAAKTTTCLCRSELRSFSVPSWLHAKSCSIPYPVIHNFLPARRPTRHQPKTLNWSCYYACWVPEPWSLCLMLPGLFHRQNWQPSDNVSVLWKRWRSWNVYEAEKNRWILIPTNHC